jgi:hypothetical protein
VGATLGAAFLAWIVQSVLFAAVVSAVYRSASQLGSLLIQVVLWAFVFGGAIGWSQSAVLKRSLESARVRWLEATLGGSLAGGLAVFVIPQQSWQNPSLSHQLLGSAVYGILGGGALGIAQALALRTVGGAVGILRWILVSLGAHVLGSLSGALMYHVLTEGASSTLRLSYIGSLARLLVDTLVTALPLGFVLGGCLYRRFGPSGGDPD